MKRTVHTSTDDAGFERSSVAWVIHAVANDGTAYPIEELGLSAQASIRKDQIEAALRAPKPPQRKRAQKRA